jgi:excisionase family DNA binding protein
VPSELLSLSDASRLLGVSAERVRQLVVAGDLPGQRFGNAWAVPREAVIARRHNAGRGGRPLGPIRAWRELLAGDVDLSRPGRYQRRAKVVRCEMSRADVEALPGAVGALDGGVRAAVALGTPLVASDERDLYLPRSAFGELGSRVAVVLDPLGPVRVRVVDDDAWALIPLDKLAPRGAIALDLLDSSDPRHWIAAEALLANA